MPIIKDKNIVEDTWVHYAGEGDLPAGDIIVPLIFWQENQEKLAGRRLGVQLEPGQHPENIQDDLEKFDVIAVHFPTFMDGRGYSYAKLLRDRYGYKKEIRAVGDVLRDQLFYMQRCGFNAYEIKEGRNIKDALKGFQDFTVKYQVSADEHLPIYRRR